jgi:hypothetical protein
MKDKKLRSFHFDVGNSNIGPLGMCLQVWAYDEDEAVEKANSLLNDVSEREIHSCNEPGEHPRIEYCTVYFNGKLTRGHIDDSDDISDQKAAEVLEN